MKLEKLKAENPEFCYISNTESLFFFIVVIAFYEMLTKPGLLKNGIRILLVSIMLGTQFADHIPISQIFDASYNTAWLLAVIAFILIVVRLAKKWIGKLNTVEN